MARKFFAEFENLAIWAIQYSYMPLWILLGDLWHCIRSTCLQMTAATTSTVMTFLAVSYSFVIFPGDRILSGVLIATLLFGIDEALLVIIYYWVACFLGR